MTIDPRMINYGNNVINLRDVFSGGLLAGMTDRQAFDAAIALVPTAGRGRIYVPARATAYNMGSGYLQYGGKLVDWEVDPGVTLTSDADWAKFNAPVWIGGNLHAPGMVGIGTRDTGQIAAFGSSGAFSADSRNGGITGITTTDELATAHERGLAVSTNSAFDSGSIKVATATFTATSFTPGTPFDANPLRVGMVVDVVGLTFYVAAETVRYSGIVTGWTLSGANATVVQVDKWVRANSAYNAAVIETPPDGRAVTINRANKIWVNAPYMFFSDTEGATYGEVSGAYTEVNIINSGARFGTAFDQNTHPRHFYGIDMNMTSVSAAGGGVAYNVRAETAAKNWEIGYRVEGAANGFIYDSHVGNNGGTAFKVSNKTGAVAAAAFVLDEVVAGTAHDIFRISGNAPEMSIGRKLGFTASTPTINFHSSGGATNYDSKIYGSGGNTTDGNGSLRINALKVILDQLPANYVNDAAAASGGLAVGGLYRNGSALMIRVA